MVRKEFVSDARRAMEHWSQGSGQRMVRDIDNRARNMTFGFLGKVLRNVWIVEQVRTIDSVSPMPLLPRPTRLSEPAFPMRAGPPAVPTASEPRE